MPTKLIRLKDGTLVEVDILSGDVRNIAGGSAETVEKTVAQIEDILETISEPVINSVNKIKQNASVHQVEIEVGLSFEGEGNLYVVKSKSSASLSVKLILNSNTEDNEQSS